MRLFLLTIILLSGIVARLYIATLGSNFDLGCWQLAGDLARSGKNVYAVDPYYNYGPIWLGFAAALRTIQHWTQFYGPNSFHLLVVMVLTAADAAVSGMLVHRYGRFVGLFFFFSPVMLLLTGFHSQVDTFALSLGLASWLLIEPRGGNTASTRRVAGAAVLMGISLSIKHICILFPFWIAMCPAIGSLKNRVIFVVMPLLIFLAGFVPFATTRAGFRGVQVHVFQYHGILNKPLFIYLLNLALPYRMLGIASVTWLGHDPIPAILEIIFVSLMLILGRWLAFRKPTEFLFAHYLLAATVLTISMADQYLAIPMIACAIFCRRWSAWIYVLVATVVLFISPQNISRSSKLSVLNDVTARFRSPSAEPEVADSETVTWTNTPAPAISYANAQLWLIPLLFLNPPTRDPKQQQ